MHQMIPAKTIDMTNRLNFFKWYFFTYSLEQQVREFAEAYATEKKNPKQAKACLVFNGLPLKNKLEALSYSKKNSNSLFHFLAKHKPQQVLDLLLGLIKDGASSQQLFDLFKMKDNCGNTAFMLMAKHSPNKLLELIPLLITNGGLTSEQLFQLFKIHKNDKRYAADNIQKDDGWAAFLLMAKHEPEKFLELIQLLIENQWLTSEQLFELLEVQNAFGDTAFMLMMKHYPQKIHDLIRHLMKLGLTNDQLFKLFKIQNDKGWTALKVIARYKPNELQRLITYLTSVGVTGIQLLELLILDNDYRSSRSHKQYSLYYNHIIRELFELNVEDAGGQCMPVLDYLTSAKGKEVLRNALLAHPDDSESFDTVANAINDVTSLLGYIVNYDRTSGTIKFGQTKTYEKLDKKFRLTARLKQAVNISVAERGSSPEKKRQLAPKDNLAILSSNDMTDRLNFFKDYIFNVSYSFSEDAKVCKFVKAWTTEKKNPKQITACDTFRRLSLKHKLEALSYSKKNSKSLFHSLAQHKPQQLIDFLPGLIKDGASGQQLFDLFKMKDNFGHTAVMDLARNHPKILFQLIPLLITNGVTGAQLFQLFETQNNFGHTAFMDLARNNPKILFQLIPLLMTNRWLTDAQVFQLFETQDNYGDTAFMLMARNHPSKLLKLIPRLITNRWLTNEQFFNLFKIQNNAGLTALNYMARLHPEAFRRSRSCLADVRVTAIQFFELLILDVDFRSSPSDGQHNFYHNHLIPELWALNVEDTGGQCMPVLDYLTSANGKEVLRNALLAYPEDSESFDIVANAINDVTSLLGYIVNYDRDSGTIKFGQTKTYEKLDKKFGLSARLKRLVDTPVAERGKSQFFQLDEAQSVHKAAPTLPSSDKNHDSMRLQYNQL